MRPYVIVTFKAWELTGTYDLEIPTDTPAGKLSSDIRETICAYRGGPVLSDSRCLLYCERLGRTLKEDETFAQAGIWNGDIIEMKGGSAS